MKFLNRAVKSVYRFRCIHCKSEFEMDEKEKKEVDWKFTPDDIKERDKDLPMEKRHTSNYMRHFDCAICS